MKQGEKGSKKRQKTLTMHVVQVEEAAEDLASLSACHEHATAAAQAKVTLPVCVFVCEQCM